MFLGPNYISLLLRLAVMKIIQQHTAFVGFLKALFLLLGFCSGVSAGTLYRYFDPEGRLIVTDDAIRVSKETPRHLEAIPTRSLGPSKKTDQLQDSELKPLGPPQTNSPFLPPDESVLPVKVHQGLPLIPVELTQGAIGPIRGDFLLDTGATITVLGHRIASFLGILKNEGQKTRIRVGGGGMIEAKRYILDALTIGPYEWKHVPVHVLEEDLSDGQDNEEQGVLGTNILKDISYRLDVSKGWLSLY